MHISARLPLASLIFATLSYSQPVSSWVTRTIAGSFPIGDGGQATSALLEEPQAVAA
jgi:hypothetical protein